MTEFLRNAWMGWHRVTGEGKLMALFLASLLFLWLEGKQEKQKGLLCYATASALCCIVPVTAVPLMLYQTRFYDYEWIWSIVPVTVITAYAGTKMAAEYWQGFRREAWRKGLPVTAGLLAAALLCGGLYGSGVDRDDEKVWKEQTECILGIVRAGTEETPESAGTGGAAGTVGTVGTGNNGICIWAPQKIMEYSRRLDSSILLPYGRNMWEDALDAYSYDTYTEAEEKMYQWMSMVEETCTESEFDFTDTVVETMEDLQLSTQECMNTAGQAGVDVLILPENTNQLLLNEVIGFTEVQPEQDSGYFFFYLDK